MAEPVDLAAAGDSAKTAAPTTSTALPPELEALRASGAAARDPVRFAYLAALARRAASQPEAIRQALTAKIASAADELAARPAAAPVQTAGDKTASPLAELLAYIGQHAHEQTGSQAPAPAAAPVNHDFGQQSKTPAASRAQPGTELKSIAIFRNEWSKLSTEQQLTQTLAQAPENAGPMNSQHLVLRSLERMRDLAPDYLQGFMSYIDTLIWLDHADPTKPSGGRAAGGENEGKTRGGKRGFKGSR